MNFFLDTEFMEFGRSFPIELISIGIVCENGTELYAVSSEFDPSTASSWIKENVLPHLGPSRNSVESICRAVIAFVNGNLHLQKDGGKPKFWGYYADYDWVVFCQMFGAMIDLPKGWPMYCRDLKQWCDQLGNPELPKQESTEHNALADARWNQVVYEFLLKKETPK